MINLHLRTDVFYCQEIEFSCEIGAVRFACRVGKKGIWNRARMSVRSSNPIKIDGIS
jgi:hypothetical protein